MGSVNHNHLLEIKFPLKKILYVAAEHNFSTTAASVFVGFEYIKLLIGQDLSSHFNHTKGVLNCAVNPYI